MGEYALASQASMTFSREGWSLGVPTWFEVVLARAKPRSEPS